MQSYLINKKMNLSTIKENMQPIYYNHWLQLVNSKDLSQEKKQSYLKKALVRISFEINEGLLKGLEFEAEKELLTRLLKKSFEVKKGIWIESNFDPNKRQIPIFELIGGEMIEKGIGQY